MTGRLLSIAGMSLLFYHLLGYCDHEGARQSAIALIIEFSQFIRDYPLLIDSFSHLSNSPLIHQSILLAICPLLVSSLNLVWF